MLGRRASIGFSAVVVAVCGGGVALAATHGGSTQTPAQKPLPAKKFVAKVVLTPHHFCHPGKKGSELDSLLD